MTYMPETNLTSSQIEADASTFEKLKTLTQEGEERTQRISKILRQAFSEAREEFQAGRTVISPLAKEVTTEAVSNFKSRGQDAADAVNKAWQDEASAADTTDRLIRAIRTLLGQAKAVVFPMVKQQSIKLNEVLSNRYGTQYTMLKDRVKLVRSWVTPAQAVETSSVETEIREETETKDSEPEVVIEVSSETVQ